MEYRKHPVYIQSSVVSILYSWVIDCFLRRIGNIPAMLRWYFVRIMVLWQKDNNFSNYTYKSTIYMNQK